MYRRTSAQSGRRTSIGDRQATYSLRPPRGAAIKRFRLFFFSPRLKFLRDCLLLSLFLYLANSHHLLSIQNFPSF